MAIRRVGLAASDPPVDPTTFVSHHIAEWDYMLMMKRRGVNIRVACNSYGHPVFSAIWRDVVADAGDEGILSVFAAGNYAASEDAFSTFPGSFSFPATLSVAATTSSDVLASWSNFGATTVDLAAPGENITSTWGGSSYQTGGGTSYSCPLVAGAAALLLAVKPHLTVDQLKAAILGSVDPLASLRGKVLSHGRLNVARALQYLTNANPPAIVITALPAGQMTPTNLSIHVTFNRPMNRASVESAFAISPAVNGTFEWTDDSRSFSFRHDASFDTTTNYTVRIAGTAQDDTGGTLDGDFDRTHEGSPEDDFIWTFRFPVPNDDFANAQSLTGSAGTVTGSNRYTTWEVGEPSHVVPGYQAFGSSVWYRWTPPETGGWFTFDLTSGTLFDSLLAVYAGNQLDQLAAVAGSDNYGSQTSSRVSFAAVGGTNYSVVVASKAQKDPNQTGPFKLAWYSTTPPGFTGTQFSPASGVPGTKITLTGTNFTGATRVLFNGASGSFTNAPTNNFDLRITAVVPPDAIPGPITIVTPHGNVTSTALFQVPPPKMFLTFSPANRLEIKWPSTSTAWVLEAAQDLNGGMWTPVAGALLMTNGESKVTLPPPAGNSFYRLKRN